MTIKPQHSALCTNFDPHPSAPQHELRNLHSTFHSTFHSTSKKARTSIYSLTTKPGTYNDNDPIGDSGRYDIIEPCSRYILNINNLRTSKCINLVGGIRGLGKPKHCANSGEIQMAFVLYLVSMQQLINIADSGNSYLKKVRTFIQTPCILFKSPDLHSAQPLLKKIRTSV